MRRIKVLHLTNFLDLSGQQENTLYTVSGLDQERFESHLAANLSGGDQNLDNILARRARAMPHLKLHDMPHLKRLPNPVHDLLAFSDMVRLIRREKFDIVHTHATKAGFFGRVAARLAGAPIIIHSVHGWPFQYTLTTQFIRNLFCQLAKLEARFTHMFVTVNQALVDDALALGVGRPEQYTVVRSGMELDKFLNVKIDAAKMRESLGLPPAGPIAGTVMIFYKHKAPDAIVRMAPKIIAAVPDVHFLLVGDGEMMPVVKSLVAELNLQDRVTLTGLRQDVNELMALMDVFLHAAQFEILPRTIVQAQATGTPVVATRLGGVPEVVKHGETGFLTPADDQEAFIEAVVRLLQDHDLRDRMGRLARSSISSAYTVEAMVAANEALYERLADARLKGASRVQVTETA